MKVIFLLLLAVTAAAHAAASDPARAALDFLEKVRTRTVNLEPGADTAISSQTAPEKKNQIARHLDRMARDLGTDSLEIGEVKLDENFAAVLVCKTGSFDPGHLQIFPVALVKHGAEWLAAPVPASFENAGAGCAIALKKRLENLEDWMLRGQITELEKLREQAASRMRQRIESQLTENDLRNYDTHQVADAFLTACEKKDASAVLGFIGGLAIPLPDDWSARLTAVNQAMANQASTTSPWRILTAPEILRVPVSEKSAANPDSFSLAYLDPASSDTKSSQPQIQTSTFGLTKSKNGLWQINLPAHFVTATAAPADDQDVDLRNTFATKWSAAHPAKPQASALSARESLTAALKEATLPALLQLTQLPTDPENARYSLTEAARIWWLLHSPAVVCHAIPLGVQVRESQAVAVFQFFSAREPDRLDAQTFYLEKSAAGWLWNPSPSPSLREPFRDWITAETQKWSGKWQQALLAESLIFKNPIESPAPETEQARQCVTHWFEAIHRGDLPTALKLTARLDEIRSGPIVLKNLGYEIASSRQDTSPPEVTRIYSGKIWTAVGMKTQLQGKPSYPLYPIIQTPQGPRILAEVDLLAADNRGRDFLNRAALQRLDGHATPEAIAELRDLSSQHKADVEALSRKLPH